MANGHGGKRPGAGRPRKAELYAKPIRDAQDAIAYHLDEIIDKAMELVRGVRATHMEKGEEVVYQRPPCIKTIAFLAEQIMGKATQALEFTGEDGGPIELTTRELTQAEIELKAWRTKMSLETLKALTERPSSGPSASDAAPTSSTPTE